MFNHKIQIPTNYELVRNDGPKAQTYYNPYKGIYLNIENKDGFKEATSASMFTKYVTTETEKPSSFVRETKKYNRTATDEYEGRKNPIAREVIGKVKQEETAKGAYSLKSEYKGKFVHDLQVQPEERKLLTGIKGTFEKFAHNIGNTKNGTERPVLSRIEALVLKLLRT